VCRDEELKQSVVQRFCTLFEVVFSINIPASVNEVLVCSVKKSTLICDCFPSTATDKKPTNSQNSATSSSLKKVSICDGVCESLVTDFCTRLVEEKQRDYVKEKILDHLSQVNVHQL